MVLEAIIAIIATHSTPTTTFCFFLLLLLKLLFDEPELFRELFRFEEPRHTTLAETVGKRVIL